jgi:hypothetical protein
MQQEFIQSLLLHYALNNKAFCCSIMEEILPPLPYKNYDLVVILLSCSKQYRLATLQFCVVNFNS